MASDAPSTGRVRLMTLLTILGIFVAGIAAGFGLARWLAPPERRPPPMWLPLDDLGLSGETLEEARAISARYDAKIRAVIEETFPKVRALREAAKAEIKDLLTPEQGERLDELDELQPPPGKGHHRRPGEHARDRRGPGGANGPRHDGPGPPDGRPPHPPHHGRWDRPPPQDGAAPREPRPIEDRGPDEADAVAPGGPVPAERASSPDTE